MKKDKLYQIISSLSKPEKRYFKLHSNTSGVVEEKKYIKIFDILANMKYYDETKFLELLKEKKIDTRYLNGDKNYLYHQIIESLAQQQNNQTAHLKVRHYLNICNILYKKGLIKQALDYCTKAKKIAKDHELILLIPNILITERGLLSFSENYNTIDQSYQAMQEATIEIKAYNHIDTLYRQSIILLKKIDKVRKFEQLEKIDDIYNSLQNYPNEQLSIYSLIRKNQCLAALYYIKNEKQKEFEVVKQNIEIIENNLKFKEEHYFEYITFFSYLLRLSKTQLPEQYAVLFQQFINMAHFAKKDKKKIQARIYSLAYSTDIVKKLDEGNFDKGIQQIDHIKKILKQFNELIPRSVHLTFQYKFAYLYYGQGDLSTALNYINSIINEYEENDRPDVFLFTHILNLIIHYELGNDVLVTYRLRSVFSLLKNRNHLFKTEQNILNCIKQLQKSKNKTERKDVLLLYKNNITKLFEEQPFEKNVLQYFDCITWLDCLLKGVSFQEMKQINLNTM